jgi:hypothetical protein
MEEAASGSMIAAVAVLDRNADRGMATSIKASIKYFSFVPTKEMIFFPIRGAAPVSKRALPTVIIPAIRKTISLPNPAKAVVKGITLKIAMARQAKRDVVANGMYSDMKRTIMIAMMMSAITAVSTKYLLCDFWCVLLV